MGLATPGSNATMSARRDPIGPKHRRAHARRRARIRCFTRHGARSDLQLYHRWSIGAATWQAWAYPLVLLGVIAALRLARKRIGSRPARGGALCGTLFPSSVSTSIPSATRSSRTTSSTWHRSDRGRCWSAGRPNWSRSSRPGLVGGAATLAAASVLLLAAGATGTSRAVIATSRHCGSRRWRGTRVRGLPHQPGKGTCPPGPAGSGGIISFEQALSIPLKPQGRCHPGPAWPSLGIFAAGEAYSEAIRINPGNVEAHVNLGNVLAGAERFETAAWHYSEALRIAPDSAEVHNNPANALADKDCSTRRSSTTSGR